MGSLHGDAFEEHPAEHESAVLMLDESGMFPDCYRNSLKSNWLKMGSSIRSLVFAVIEDGLIRHRSGFSAHFPAN